MSSQNSPPKSINIHFSDFRVVVLAFWRVGDYCGETMPTLDALQVVAIGAKQISDLIAASSSILAILTPTRATPSPCIRSTV
jgi:hypothetical protein